MSDNTSKLTNEEMEDVQAVMGKMLEKISNKYNIDRDSLLGYFTIALSVFCEMVTAKKMRIIAVNCWIGRKKVRNKNEQSNINREISS